MPNLNDVPAQALHPETMRLVNSFARALKHKLLAAQVKYGYSDNWKRDDWADECRAELMQHIQKGDPRDVAAYCAFLWHHNELTAIAQSAVVLDDERAAFEAAFSHHGAVELERLEGGYKSPVTNCLWMGWQARAVSPQATGGDND